MADGAPVGGEKVGPERRTSQYWEYHGRLLEFGVDYRFPEEAPKPEHAAPVTSAEAPQPK